VLARHKRLLEPVELTAAFRQLERLSIQGLATCFQPRTHFVQLLADSPVGELMQAAVLVLEFPLAALGGQFTAGQLGQRPFDLLDKPTGSIAPGVRRAR
jgi:hypothetical protein